ncbi:MAG: DUF3493 domain-containing protein [Leptolyngbyaceae bacterium]|nr:DUF3493 domain-containing protein [Leptolyngbyaceae bacterium]
MVNSKESKSTKFKAQRANLSLDRYARLRAEAKAPYRILRQFVYIAFAASGFIGALVFLAEVVTAHNMASAVPNLALQVGVLALMLWLLKIDRAG